MAMLTLGPSVAIVNAQITETKLYSREIKQLQDGSMLNFLFYNFILGPSDEVSLPKVHCRQCHRTSSLTTPKAPEQCSNHNGYSDENGVDHPKCPHRRLWYVWPEDFDINTCLCETCKIIWQIEQQRLKAGYKPAEPKKRGRPFKKD
jgi:hypothetical protein